MDAPQVEQDTSVPSSRISSRVSGRITGTAAIVTRAFNRIFTRHTMNAALLMLLALLLSGNLRQPKEQLHDPDLWWHLADARILSATHRFIRVEPYSFTVAGEHWINPEWLSEMPFWLGYRSLGLTGIYLVTMIGLWANLLFVYWRSYRKAGHAGAAFWTGALGFVLMTPNAGPRTIVFAYLALSAEMAILEAAERGKTWLLWLLPPLFCMWINLHGSWVIGLGLLGLYILCGVFPFNKGVFEQQAFGSKDRKRLLLVLCASLAALLANPYGWRLVWNPLDMMLNQKLNIAVIEEWQPLSLGGFAGKAAVAAIGLFLAANCIRGRKWKLYELAFIFFAWFAAFDHARFTFLAAVIAIPFLTGDVVRSFFAKPHDTTIPEKTIPVLNALIVAGAVCAMAYFFPAEASLQKGLAEEYPLQSIASIQPSWRTFNQDSLGGMMDFNSKPTFFDSRVDTFEHHGVLRDFLAIMRIQEPLKLLDRYRIDHVLVQANMPLSYLLERTPGWRIEKREGTGADTYELFAKTPGISPNQAPCATPSAAGLH
jgi:hypothetical protein